MKKLFFFVATLGLVALASCGGNEGGQVVTLTVSTPAEAPADGGEVTFKITTTGDWKITEDADWFAITTLEGTGDAEVTVVVDKNDGAARNASVTVKVGGDTKSTTVTQAGLPFEVTNPAPAEATAGEVTFDITTTLAWEITAPAETWLTVTTPLTGEGNQAVKVSLTANTDAAQRTSNINIKAVGSTLSKTVTITQKGHSSTGFNYADLLSAYSATGSPSFLTTPGPASFASALLQPQDENGTLYTDYYGVKGWAGVADMVWFLNVDVNGVLTPDQEFVLFEDTSGTFDGIFTVFHVNDAEETIYFHEDATFTWDGATTLDMSFAPVDGYDVLIGVLAFDKVSGQIGGAFDDCYADMQFVKSDATSASVEFKGVKANIDWDKVASYQVAKYDVKNMKVVK